MPKTTIEEPVAVRLKRYCDENGFNAEQGADSVGANPRTFENWLQGVNEPRGIGRAALVNFLNEWEKAQKKNGKKK